MFHDFIVYPGSLPSKEAINTYTRRRPVLLGASRSLLSLTMLFFVWRAVSEAGQTAVSVFCSPGSLLTKYKVNTLVLLRSCGSDASPFSTHVLFLLCSVDALASVVFYLIFRIFFVCFLLLIFLFGLFCFVFSYPAWYVCASFAYLD